MTTKNKIIVILGLVLSMLFTLANLSFAQPSDIENHWAGEQISNWTDKGLAAGYPDGTFRPDNSITRAEFITLVNSTFGFTAVAEINFPDVSSGDWFAGEVARAGQAGYIAGYEDGTFRPNDAISRQEAAVILARILMLDLSSNTDATNQFKDNADISQWSKGSVGAVVIQGLMKGYPDQTYRPAELITRAEAIVTLDRAITASRKTVTYDNAGTYGPETGTEEIDGNVSITAAGVTLQNVKITGDLLLAEGIGEGDVTLKNVTVLGKTTVKGGGSHSVVLDGCNMPSITIDKEGVRLVATGNTSVSVVQLESGAILVEMQATGPGFEAVNISQEIPAGVGISLSGNFTKVNLAGPVSLTVASGTVAELTVAAEATGSTISLAGESRVNTLSLDAEVTVAGTGAIDKAIVNVSGSTIAPTPADIEKAEGVTVTVGASSSSSGSTGSGSGTGTGGGNGVAALNLTGVYLVNGDVIETSSDEENWIISTPVPADATFKLVFDRGVVRDHWVDHNENCFSMSSSSGAVVPISVDRAANWEADYENEKSNIYISPNSNLTAGKAYTITISEELQANNDQYINKTTITLTVASSGGGGTPAKPAFESAEVTLQGDLSITFDKDMADPSGKQAQFTVKVDGVDDVVTAAQTTSTSTKIKLVLTTKVTGGQLVTVAYTKGADAASQIKAADGVSLEIRISQFLVMSNC